MNSLRSNMHSSHGAAPLHAAAPDPENRVVLPASTWRQRAARCESLLGHAVEAITSLALVIEIVLLFAGVLARYVLHAPLTWSDELAETLFAWVATLGAVIAWRRGAHMRMLAFVRRGGRRLPSGYEGLSLAVSLALLVLLMQPAWNYAVSELPIVTDALQISDVWRAASLPVSVALMIAFGMLRLGRSVPLRAFLIALGCVALLGGMLWFLQEPLASIGRYNLLVFFVLIVGGAIFLGVPIAFAFGIGTLAYLCFIAQATPDVMIGRMEEGMSHLELLAVPLCIFLGALVVMTGMASAMVDFLACLIGHVRGGLHYVLIGAMYLVSGISGSKAADMAAVAPVLFPEMRKRGASDGEMIALLSAAGAQTETIPPSIVLVTIGSVTNVSIAALFEGGLVPALLLGIFLCIGVWSMHRRDPSQGPRSNVAQMGRAFVVAWPALVLPLVIRFAVIKGIATATEVSTVGVAYALMYGIAASLLFRKRIAWRTIYPALVDTVSLSGAILLIIGTATAMAWALTQSGFSHQLAQTLAQMPGGKVGFLAVSIVAFVLLGSVLEGIPAIVLFGPLLFPIAQTIGVNEVHYAMVVILSMGIGLFSPPFGVGYYAVCAVSRIDPAVGMRSMGRYFVLLLIGTVLVAAIPWLSTGFM